MSAKANTTKIGLFVILAVALLIVGLLAFGAKGYFTPKTRGETAIPGEVSGLSVGSPVQLRGVPVGKVTRITFAWNLYPKTKSNLIVVEFEIDGNLLPLPPGMTTKEAVARANERGLRAIVKSQGITGTSLLALENLNPSAFPPPPIDYEPRHYYIPSAPAQLTRLVDSLGKTLDHLEQLDVAAISQGVTNTLASVNGLIVKLNKLNLENLGTNVNTLLADLKGTSGKLTDTIEDVRKTIDGLKLGAVGQNANGLLTELRGSNEKLQTVLDHLGTAPLQQTVANLQQALQTLNATLVDLKEYPSGFLFGKPPQPVEGVQPARQ